MGNDIDRRIVEMEFDNQQFERRVKTTRESLKGLKNDLDFDDTAKKLSSFEKTMNNMDLSGVTSGLENISNKFSAMGAVGFTVMQNLTNTAIGFGKKLADSTFGQILSGGKNRALNLEQAQFQISGLGVDWNKATESGVSLYDQIDKAVSGTAYGLDAAAKVAGQLLASNIEAGTDKMQNALSGISGVAAMTNSTYEEIGHIFTTIAGNGRIMAEQLNQFAGRGLNVAATLAKHLQVTEAELRDMVSKGKVDFNTFAEAMNNAFGEQATKANDTYTGSLSNVKAALSRIGEKFQTPYLNNMRQTFVALIPVLNGVKTSLEPVYETASKGMEYFRKEAVNTLSKLAVFDEQGKTVIKGMSAISDRIKKLTDNLKFKDYVGNTVFDYLLLSYKSLKSIFASIKGIVLDVVKPISNAFNDLFPIHRITHSLSNGLAEIKIFLNKLETLIAKNGDSITRIASGVFSVFGILINISKSLIKIVGKVILAFADLLKPVLKLLAPIGDLANEVYRFFIRTDWAKNSLKPLTESLKTLKSTIEKLWNVFRFGMNVAFAPFNAILKEGEKNAESFSSKAARWLGGFADIAGKAIFVLNNFLEAHIETVKNVGKTIGNVFGKIATNGFLKTAFNGVKSFFSNFIKGFKGFKNELSAAGDGVEKTITRLKKSTGPFEAIGKFFASIWELLKSVISKVRPIVKSFVQTVFDAFAQIAAILKNGVDGLNEVSGKSLLLSGGFVATLIMVMKKVEKFLNKIEETNENDLLGKVKKLLGGLTDYINTLKKTKVIQSMKDFAAAILEIAVAVLILSSIDPVTLVHATGAITGLIWEMVGACNAITGLVNGGSTMKIWEKSSKSVVSIGTMMLELAAAILALTFSLKILEGSNPDKIMTGLGIISGLLWELVAVAKVLSSSGEKKILAGISSVIAMAVAIRVLIKGVTKLSSLDPKALERGLSAISGLMIALGLLIIASGMGDAKALKSSATAMLVFTIAFSIMVKQVKKFAEIEWDTLAKAVVSIAAISGILVGINAMEKLGIDAAKNAVKIASALAIIGGALGYLALSMLVWKLIDWSEMARAETALTSITVILTGVAAMEKAGINVAKDALKISSAFSIIGGALAGLALSLLMWKLINWKEMAKAGVALAAITTILVGVAAMEKLGIDVGKDSLKIASSLAIMGGALIALAAGFIVFKVVSFEDVAKGIITVAIAIGTLAVLSNLLKTDLKAMMKLSQIMAVLGVAMVLLGAGLVSISAGLTAFSIAIASLFTSIAVVLVEVIGIIPLIFKIISAAVKEFLTMIVDVSPYLKNAFIALVNSILKGIQEVIPEIQDTALQILDAIIAVIPKLGAAIETIIDTLLPIIVKYIPKIVDGLVTILIGIINSLAERIPELIGAITNFFKKLFDSIDVNALIAFANKIGDAMLSISISMAIIAMIPIPAALAGIAGLAIVVAGLTAILAGLGALSNIEGFAEILESGGKIFATIGKAVGDFIGNVIGGIVGNVSDTLPGIGKALSSFMINAQPFIDGAKTITPNVVDGLLGLCKVILALTAAELIQGIAGFFGATTDFSLFGKQLSDFAPYLVRFSKTASEVDADAVSNAADAALALANFASAIPNSGGLFGKIFGENDLGDWAPQLAPFGDALAKFSEAVNGKIDSAAVETACKAGLAIANMAKEIPNEGGWLGAIVGENSLSIFGPEMADFGGALAKFSEAVKGKIDAPGVETACKAGISIANMAKEIPNEGGWLGAIVGENSLSIFGPEMADFGKSLALFSENVSGKINPTWVENACTAGTKIIEMAKSIPNEGGIFGFLLGDNKLSDFGPELAAFGRYLADFSINVGNSFGNMSSIENACAAGIKLVEMTNNVPNEGGVLGFFGGDKSLASVGPDIAEFGKHLAMFSENIGSNFNDEAVSKAADAGLKIANMVNNMPNSGGLAGKINGTKDIAGLAPNLPNLGMGLAGFNEAVSKNEIKQNNVDAACKAGITIAEMVGKLPKEGGWVQKFTGIQKIAEFGDDIVKLGESLARFSEEVSGENINGEKVSAACEAGKAITSLINTIPKEDGFLQKFTGVAKIGENVENIKNMGNALASFATAMSSSSIDPEKVSSATSAGEALATMIDNIPEEKGIAQGILGTKDIGNNVEDIKNLGVAVATFCETVSAKNVDLSKIDAASTASQAIAGMIESIPYSQGLADGLIGIKNIGQYGDDIKKLGIGVMGFCQAVSTEKIDIDQVTAAATAGTAIANMIQVLPKEGGAKDYVNGTIQYEKIAEGILNIGWSMKGFDNIVQGINVARLGRVVDDVTALVLTINKISKSESDGIKNFGEELKALGEAGIDRLIEAFDESSARTVKAITVLLTSMVNEANEYVNVFIKTGEYLINGLVIGVMSKRNLAVDAATAVAQAMVDAHHKTLDERSPSKIGIESGMNWDMGLAIGLTKYSKVAIGAAKDNANGIVSTTIGLLSGLNDINLDDINPTITPVMDLSNVSAGIRSINGAMSNMQTYSITSSISSDRARFNKNETDITVETTSKDVVNAVNRLNSRISQLEEAILNRPINMDGRTVSKILAPSIDAELGTRYTHARRGN